MNDTELTQQFENLKHSLKVSSIFTIFIALITLTGVIAAATIGYNATIQAVKEQNQSATTQFTKNQQALAYTDFISAALKLENGIYNYANLFLPANQDQANASSPKFSELRELHEKFITTYYNCQLFQPNDMKQTIDNLSNPLEEAYGELINAGLVGGTNLDSQTLQSINDKYNIDRRFNDFLEEKRVSMIDSANKQLWS